jgi:hypothetical protein
VEGLFFSCHDTFLRHLGSTDPDLPWDELAKPSRQIYSSHGVAASISDGLMQRPRNTVTDASAVVTLGCCFSPGT